jgi:hypothetical protein
LINEIHADPDPVLGDANGDGEVDSNDDEFIELVNLGTQEVNLGGWEIKDQVKIRFIFPADVKLGAGCAVVVFGGESPAPDQGNFQVFSASSLGLNNNGDEIQVISSAGEIISQINYGPEGGNNQSLNRYPDLDIQAEMILHSQIPEALGKLYSPGLSPAGEPIGHCPDN